jgi:transcriptional regulator with XRE-family HTH domain
MKPQMLEYRVHHGRNVKRLREMLGIKQEAIAIALDLTQQAMSKLEQKDVIEDYQLDIIASVLRVPVEAIKKMNDEATVNYINSLIDNINNEKTSKIDNCFTNYTFNPIDKIIALYDSKIALYNDKIELYERMLKIEHEKMEMLQKKNADN